MSVCCECCVLSGMGLCDELITHPEESYRLWCVDVCDLEAKITLVNEDEGQDSPRGYRAKKEKVIYSVNKHNILDFSKYQLSAQFF